MNRRNFLRTTGLASLSAAAAAITGQSLIAGPAFAQAKSSDPLNAFVAYGPMNIQTTKKGPLAGLRFAVKDSYDIQGYPTGTGSPAWLTTHPVAAKNAPSVDVLLAAGAIAVGKTHMDELAWSLMGENVHYGTPKNSAAPDRIPGGSSSGSAAAVAGGAVDFAMGGDTGGSIRVPAAFCGIYGLRPTHNRIPDVGTTPLAPSYDTVGFFARDAKLMERLGEVLFKEAPKKNLPRRIIIATDQFELAGADMSAAVQQAVDKLVGIVGRKEVVTLGSLAERKVWLDTFRIIQTYEIWQTHGEWVTAFKPTFGPGISDRFAAAAKLPKQAYDDAVGQREKIVARMNEILGDDAVMVFPTTPGVAPKLRTPEVELNAFRGRLLEMLCPAGHAGLPQMSVPVAKFDGAPVGLSLVGARNADMTLLALAKRI
jgi:amidase